MGKKPLVSIVHRDKIPETPANHTEKSRKIVAEMIEEAVELLGGITSVVRPGDRVVIKPNAVWPITADAAITTDPRVVEAVVKLVKEKTDAQEVVLAERTGVSRRTVDSLKATGIEEAARRGGVDRIVYLEDDPRIPIKISQAKALLSPIYASKTILEADTLIYLPKMKTHKQTGVSMCMKLSQGTLIWSDMMRCHRFDIEQKFVDLLRITRPNLCIIDGIWAQQGQGPGSPYPRDIIKDRNLIVAGCDPVATDAVAAATMGFEPLHDLGTVRGATLDRLGEGDLAKIEVAGKKIEEVKRFFRRGTCSLVGLHPKIEVYAGGACIGCAGFTRTGLEPLLFQPERLKEVEKIVVILGYKTEVPDNLKHNPPTSYVLVVGDCAEEHKERGIFFSGCASLSVHELIDFLGMDNEGVEKMYWKLQPRGYVP